MEKNEEGLYCSQNRTIDLAAIGKEIGRRKKKKQVKGRKRMEKDEEDL